MYEVGNLLFCLGQRHPALLLASQWSSCCIAIQAAEGIGGLKGSLFVPEMLTVVSPTFLRAILLSTGCSDLSVSISQPWRLNSSFQNHRSTRGNQSSGAAKVSILVKQERESE